MTLYTAMRDELEKISARPAWIAKHTVSGLVGRGVDPEQAQRTAGLVADLYRAGKKLRGTGFGGIGPARQQLAMASAMHPKGGGIKPVPEMSADDFRLLPKGLVPALAGGAVAGLGLRHYLKKKKEKAKMKKISEIIPTGVPTGLTGLGTHISRTVSQRGGTYNMMMLGLRDPATDQFTGQLMDLVNKGRFAQARQVVTMANFPDDMRDRILGTLDSLRGQPAIPDHYRSMSLLGAFDPR